MKGVLEHLCNLIRIPSVSSRSNRPIIDYAANTLRNARWQVSEMVYEDTLGVEKVNLIAAPPGQNLNDPLTELAFVCHTDTVPYAAEWTQATDPFLANGLLYGCGACDVKGFLACLLTAVAEVDPTQFLEGLRLILTADEEVGCIGASRLLESRMFRARRLVIGEPTSLHPARAGKGYCLAEITVFGEEAHSAHPRKGKSAIYRAARLITAIEEFALQLEEDRNRFFSPAFTTLNVGTIHGGTAKNIVPGQCSFQLEWRPIPGQSAGTVPSGISRILDGLREIAPDFHLKLHIVRQQAGFETSEASELVRRVESLTGRAATSIPFGSEASLLATAAEEIIVFGPGDMRTAHSDRECVPLAELNEATSCLKTLMTAMQAAETHS
jgi:acetylornithine deacetylase